MAEIRPTPSDTERACRRGLADDYGRKETLDRRNLDRNNINLTADRHMDDGQVENPG